MQAKMGESGKKVESLVVVFQNLNQETRMKNNEQAPILQEENDIEKGELEDGKWKNKIKTLPKLIPV